MDVIFTKIRMKIAMFILIDMASSRRITWNLMFAMVSDVQCCQGPLEKELRIEQYGPCSLSPLLFYVHFACEEQAPNIATAGKRRKTGVSITPHPQYVNSVYSNFWGTEAYNYGPPFTSYKIISQL